MDHVKELRRRAMIMPLARWSDEHEGAVLQIPQELSAFDAKRGILLGLAVVKTLADLGGCGLWLASISFRARRPRPAKPPAEVKLVEGVTFTKPAVPEEDSPPSEPADWSKARWGTAKSLLRALVDGIGDPACERAFTGTMAVCLQRAMTQAEEEELGEDWRQVPPVDPAAAPVKILWETEAAGKAPATRPCANLTIDRSGGYPVPIECGACDSCHARLEAWAACRTWAPPAPLVERVPLLVDPSGRPVRSGDLG